MPDQRERERGDGAQGKDGRDSGRGVVFVCVDSALRGDNRRDAADRGPHGKQRRELRSEMEAVTEPGHERQGQD